MDDNKVIKQILENAEIINSLHAQIHKTSAQRDQGPQARAAWLDAAKKMHSSYDALAFPGGLEKGMALLKAKDYSILPTIFAYLKADPYYHRSGYIKETILRLLKKFTFTPEQIKELQDILIDIIVKCHRREYPYYCSLAVKVSDAHFLDRIHQIINQSDDANVTIRAQYMLNFLLAHSQ